MDNQRVPGMIVGYLTWHWVVGYLTWHWVVGYLTWHGYSEGPWDDSRLLTWHGYSEGPWDDSRLFNLAWVLRESLG